MSDQEHAHETLIIKRGGGGHHDEHHGGVWKIAFADFMTAMMAFFLVMWLISANDKTKATIAKYFNPIELVDSTPQPSGLNDAKKDDPNVPRRADKAVPETPGKEQKAADKNTPAPEKSAPAFEAGAPKPVDETPLDDADQSAHHDEVEVIKDPYAVIAEMETKKSSDPPKQSVPSAAPAPASGTGAVGLKGGEAFRDPFAPQPLDVASNPLAPSGDSSVPAAGPPPAPPPAPPVPTAPPASPQAAATEAGAKPAEPAPAGKAAVAPGTVTGTAAAAAPADADAAHRPADDKPMPPAALQARIAAIVKSAEHEGAAGPPASAPKVEVRQTAEGTLISLTDTADFSMFGSASARPSAQTVALMEKIGRLLKSQKGGVTIRGFTDSRPFRSDTYDNWRLSTERAHIAQYMLIRGGLDEMRIDTIEGYADRHPKNPKDPEGAENRRIEILLRTPLP